MKNISMICTDFSLAENMKRTEKHFGCKKLLKAGPENSYSADSPIQTNIINCVWIAE